MDSDLTSIAMDGKIQASPPEEGCRLVRAFLRIESPEHRISAIEFVESLASVDEAGREHRRVDDCVSESSSSNSVFSGFGSGVVSLFGGDKQAPNPS